MPRYDFRCATHGTFEIQKSIHDVTPVTCPDCGAPARQQFTTSAAVIMRPDGWNLSPDDPNYSKNLVDRSKPEQWKTHL